MDLTITLEEGAFLTNLYEKPLALHLYIPPHSCHQPSVRQSLVSGGLHHILTLISSSEDQIAAATRFYNRLRVRGYNHQLLQFLFQKALLHSHIKNTAPPTDFDPCYLHLTCNPGDPPRKLIQATFNDTILHPKKKDPFYHLRNNIDDHACGDCMTCNKLTIAYHKPSNLKNILFPRQAEKRGHDVIPVSVTIKAIQASRNDARAPDNHE